MKPEILIKPNIKRISNLPKHHFFGYYGINPWDRSFQFHLALETDFHEHRPTKDDTATVGLLNKQTQEFIPYAKTAAFNFQQGSMMHWIGNEFTFNDWENQALVSRVMNTKTGVKRTIHGAIAAVSPNEPIAIGLNYQRMSLCRSVVGYASGLKIENISAQPDDDGLFLLNIEDGSSQLILSIADVLSKVNDERLKGGLTWFNHVLFNTDGTRILFFCRVRSDKGFYSSLWTVNPDGSDLTLQIPFDYRISHFDWKSPTVILVTTDIVNEMGFVEFTDGMKDFKPIGRGVLPNDGHASYSPDREWLLCDTYPRGPDHLAELMLYNVAEKQKYILGKFHHEEKFSGDIRCDLHPRWSSDGKIITFDSVHEGSRQIYCIDLT